jgi:hypothetical protein
MEKGVLHHQGREMAGLAKGRALFRLFFAWDTTNSYSSLLGWEREIWRFIVEFALRVCGVVALRFVVLLLYQV